MKNIRTDFDIKLTDFYIVECKSGLNINNNHFHCEKFTTSHKEDVLSILLVNGSKDSLFVGRAFYPATFSEEGIFYIEMSLEYWKEKYKLFL